MQIDLELYREEVEVEPGGTISLIAVAPEQLEQTLVLVHGFGGNKFPRVQAPTMVIRGERDRVFPEAAFAEVSKLVPGEDDVNVGASAHMVMIERRDAVNRAIERFMDEDGAGVPYSRWRRERARPGQSRLLAERPGRAAWASTCLAWMGTKG